MANEARGVAVEFGLFLLGLPLGILWFSVVLLPLVYGLPRSIVWASRRWITWRAPIRYAVGLVLWNLAFFVAAVGVALVFPGTHARLYDSPGFWWGSNLGVLFCVGRVAFARSARRDVSTEWLWRGRLTSRGLSAG
jgi:hypothetical protein